MKLKEIKIVNIGGFRNHFNLPQIWDNVENGTLLEFEKNELNAQTTDGVKEITEILSSYEEKRLKEITLEFWDGTHFFREILAKNLRDVAKSSRSHDGSDFYTRNAAFIDQMTGEKTVCWNQEAAVIFYLLLLLMIQGNPRGTISKEDREFITETVSRFQTNKRDDPERESIPKLFNGGDAGILYLDHEKIVNYQGKVVFEEKELKGFAYAPGTGILGYCQNGELASWTPVQVRWYLESAKKKLKEQGDDGKIVMASAYGQNFAFLTKKGNVITNIVSEKIRQWKKIHWIGLGLNSITAIVGKNRMIEQIGSSKELSANFTDVKTVCTRTDRECRYAVLENSGVLTMDDGMICKDVTAIELNRLGYLYAVKHKMIFRKFDETDQWIYNVEGLNDGKIVEICSAFEQREERIAIRWQRQGKTGIQWIFMNQFQKDQQRKNFCHAGKSRIAGI